MGLWTGTDPLQALAGIFLASWVAIRPDLCSAQDAATLAAHFKIFVWEDVPTDPQKHVSDFKAAGYIGQAEAQNQLDACLASNAQPPRALVGAYFAPGWTPMLEVYGVGVPSDLGQGFPVLGVYDDMRLAPYLPSLGHRDFSIYLAEGMLPEDWLTLHNLVS